VKHHLKQRKKYSKSMRVLVLWLTVTAVIVGCSDSGKTPNKALPIAPKQVQKPVSQPTATVADQQPEVEFSYSTGMRRDPFAPIMEKEDKQAKASERPPLERYNLFDFKFSGVVWGGFGYNAMLEGPDGKGYFVRVGTIIGPNKGVIKKITQTKVTVEEKFKNFSGEIERKEIVIELRKKQEGMQ
jgi:Tfp pilus assembly protein PilP